MASRKLTVIIAGDSRALERAFGRAQKSSVSFTGRMTRDLRGVASSLGLVAGAGGLLGVTLALKDATQSAADFELTMQKVVGLSGVAQGKIAGLSNEVLKLAPQVGKGPQELAEALFFITSSGIDAAHAMGVLEASAKGAAAGLGDTQTVADAVTSVMNAYGANVVSAASATDTLIATVREGKGEASEFAGVIGNVVSIASQLGVSFNDVGAALAAMTRLGTDAETAATQLQQVFSNLVKVAPKQEQAFEAVGLSAAGLRKELKERGLLATLRTIQTAFAGDLPGLSQAFGDIRALRGVLALVGNQSEATRGIFERLNDSAGSLGEAFGAVSQTAAQKFARFNAAVDVTRLTIGAAFAPAAEKAATAVADWLAKTENQQKIQEGVTETMRTLGSVLKDIKGAFDNLLAVVRPTVDALGGLKNTAKLLLAVLVASKIVAYASALTGLGNAALTADAKAKLLRTTLLRLGAIGVITIGVEVIINRREITKKLNELTDDLPGPRGVKGGTVDLTKLNLEELLKLRDKMKGFSGPLVGELDKAIKKAIKLNATLGSLGANASGRVKTGGTNNAKTGGKSIADAIGDALDFTHQQINKRIGEGKAKLADSAKAFKETFKVLQGQIDLAAASGSAQGEISALRKLERAILAEINVEGRTGDLVKKLGSVRKDIAQKAEQAAKDAKEKQKNAFEATIAILGAGLDKAEITPRFSDDIAILQKQQKAILAQIKVEGRTASLITDLAGVRAKITEATKGQKLAPLFKRLGFSATGEDIIPGGKNLKKQFDSLSDRLDKSGIKLASKLRSQLGGVGKVLVGDLSKIPPEIREKIKDIFDAVRDALKNNKGLLTKTTSLNSNKILAGLGLDEDQIRELRSRLSKFNSAGQRLAPQAAGTVGAFGMVVPAGPTEVHTTVELDGRVIARNTTKHQQTRSRRNPPQKRGPHGI